MSNADVLSTHRRTQPAPQDGWLRAGAVAALVAAAGFLLVSVDSLLRGGAETVRDAVLIPAWLGAMVALAAVHRTGGPAGRLRRVGIWLVLVGMAGAGIALVAHVAGVDGVEAAGPAFGLLWLVGMVLFAVGAGRDGALGRRLAVAVAVTEPGTIALGAALSAWRPIEDFGSYTGAAVNGVVFALLARELAARVTR